MSCRPMGIFNNYNAQWRSLQKERNKKGGKEDKLAMNISK